jgi:hypothetical protein
MANAVPAASVGPHSRVRFYAVAPDGTGTRHESLVEARKAVKVAGRGWYVEGRRELIEE